MNLALLYQTKYGPKEFKFRESPVVKNITPDLQATKQGCHETTSDVRYRYLVLILVSIPWYQNKISIGMRYLEVSIPELGIEIRYRKVSIP